MGGARYLRLDYARILAQMGERGLARQELERVLAAAGSPGELKLAARRGLEALGKQARWRAEPLNSMSGMASGGTGACPDQCR